MSFLPSLAAFSHVRITNTLPFLLSFPNFTSSQHQTFQTASIQRHNEQNLTLGRNHQDVDISEACSCFHYPCESPDRRCCTLSRPFKVISRWLSTEHRFRI